MARLEIDIAGNLDGLSKSISQAESQLESFSKKAISIGKTLSLSVTAPLAAISAASLKTFSDVEKGLREVNSLFGLVGEEGERNFQDLTNIAKEASKELGILQSDVVPGLYNSISAGVPKDNVFDFIQVAGKAAIGGVTDINTSVDGLTSIINAFNKDFSEAGAVADSVFAAIQGGKTTFEELSASIFNIAPAAAASKVSIEEVNAAIATLTSSGTPTTVATTQLRAALTGLQRPSAELDKIFQALGFKNAQLAIEAKGLGFALDAVRTASNGNNGALKNLLGSVEAVAAANVIAGSGAEKFNQELDRQANSAGAANKAFEEVNKSFARQIEQTKVIISNAFIEIGAILAPVVSRINSGLQSVLGQFDKLSTSGKTVVVAIGAVAAAIGPLLIAFGSLGLALPAITAGLAGLKVALVALTGPFGLISAAVVTATALIFKLNAELKRTKEIAGEVRDARLDENFKQIKNEVEELGKKFQQIDPNLTDVEAFNKALDKTIESYAKLYATQLRAGNLDADILNKQIQFLKTLRKSLDENTESVTSLGNATKTTLEEFSKLADIQNEKVFARWEEEAQKYNDQLKETIDLQKRIANIDFRGLQTTASFDDQGNKIAGSERKIDLLGTLKIVEIDIEGIEIPSPEIADIDESKKTAFLLSLQDFKEQVSQILSTGVGNALGDFAFSIGEAIGAGENVLQSAGASILKGVATIASQLGQAAIAIGVGMIAIKKSFTNPFTAIAAGVALVALSGFISSQVPKIAGGGGSSSGTSGVNVSGTSQSLTGSGSSLLRDRQIELAGDFKIDGRDLRYIINQENRRG